MIDNEPPPQEPAPPTDPPPPEAEPFPYVAAGLAYARAVAAGEIAACIHVRQATARYLKDLDAEAAGGFPYRFDFRAAERVCKFISLLKHVKGPKAGTRIKLEPWQCFVLTNAFGWLVVDTGKRRFRRVYIEVARGNAKSTLSSAVALYMLAADSEGGAEVYSLATTREQARIVFRDAQTMAKNSPEFRARFGIHVAAHAITQLQSASRFEALSSQANSLDGLNIHFACVDEIHAHKTREVWDVIETATGKRDQSLMWAITTAGSDRTGICYEIRSYLIKVLQGVAPDDAFFGIIYTLDDDDDWTSEAAIMKANPNWGVSVMPDVIRQLLVKAMQMPAAQANFKTKHCDVWVNADRAWMDMRAWDRCADPTLAIEDFTGEPCTVGLDLASKVDIAAKIRVFQKVIGEQTHYFVFGRYYLPEDAVTDGRNSQYSGWEVAGRLVTTPGDVLDFDRIKDDLIDDSRTYQLDEIGYDPWQATQLAQQLQAEGANVIEYRNTVANFSAPMKEIDALVRDGRLHHDGDPVLGWMISNVVCHTDAKDNIYPRKERSENKIDGVIALITALGRIMTREQAANPFALGSAIIG